MAPGHSANDLAQGCPARLDLLNISCEGLHRWPAPSGCFVSLPGQHAASLSFADGLVLVGSSHNTITTHITAYLRWCPMLGAWVTKVQS